MAGMILSIIHPRNKNSSKVDGKTKLYYNKEIKNVSREDEKKPSAYFSYGLLAEAMVIIKQAKATCEMGEQVTLKQAIH